jgi:hypothetical protein
MTVLESRKYFLCVGGGDGAGVTEICSVGGCEVTVLESRKYVLCVGDGAGVKEMCSVCGWG